MDPVTVSAAAPSIFSGANMAGLLSGGASLLGGLLGNRMSQQSQESQQGFSAEQFAKRYQTTVEDMKAAGLNPMLAYSQGGGSPPQGSSFTASNPAAGIGSAYQSASSARQGEQKVPSEIDLMGAQTSSASSSASLNDKQRELVGNTIDKVKAETKNLGVQNDQIEATVKLLAEQAKLATQQGLSAAEQAKVFQATVRQISNQAELLGFDIKAAKDMSNAGRSMGQLKPFFDLLLGVLKTLR